MNTPDTAKRSYSTPILFVIFNRPDTAQLVFNEIKKAKPRYLYVAADGPRNGNEKDTVLCKKSRAIIDQVDWDCEVKTLFQEKNLGCKMGVSSAISWFFQNVEAGIILEDDCVPHQSFFRFAEEMLEKYKNEEKIMMITGLNPISNYQSSTSYFFSRYFFIWGWATWRRAWQKYDISMIEWPNTKPQEIEQYYNDKYASKTMGQSFEDTHRGKIDTWDYQWVFAGLVNKGLNIVPAKNLISNVGLTGVHFSGSATYNQNLPVFDLYQDGLVPPSDIEEDVNFDSVFCKKNFHPNIYRKIRSIFAKSKTLKKLYHLMRDKTD